jgi:hypothetical protein
MYLIYNRFSLILTRNLLVFAYKNNNYQQNNQFIEYLSYVFVDPYPKAIS